MSNGPFLQWNDEDGKLDPALWDRIDRSFRASILYNELTAAGVEIFENKVPSNVERLWRVQKPQLNGLTEPVLTLLGKERTLRRSTLGKRAWGDAKRLTNYYVRDIDELPAMSSVWKGAMKKMDSHRGILDAQGFAEKAKAYAHVNEPDTDPMIIENMKGYVIEVLEDLQEAFKHAPIIDFDMTNEWISQFKPNRNAGWPYHMPISKERMLTQDLPNFRPAYQRIMDAQRIDEDLYSLEVSSVKNANDKIYTAFYRSPDRLIHAARIFLKIMGAWMNHSLIANLKDNCDISWSSIDTLNAKISAGMSRSECTIHDDLAGYDTTFGKASMTAMYEALVESEFMTNHPKMRNVLLFLFYESMKDSVLQLTPMHAMKMRAALWSGTPITQFAGSICHLAMYKYLEDRLSLGIVNQDVLSDDGMLCVDNSASEAEKLIFGEWSDIVGGMGMRLHPDKSFIADLNNTVRVGEYQGREVEYHDVGPYLQFLFQRDSSLTHGVVPRRKWSLFEMERDSSQEGIRAVLKTHSTALSDVRSGNEIPEAYFDLYRSMSILTTIRPGYVGIDDTLAWFKDSWPNFDRRFTKLQESVDDKLWDQPIPIAGGTLDSGLDPRWVTDYYTEWLATGEQPSLWNS
jgi:hypothetical protein